jgi:hypothetical protein
MNFTYSITHDRIVPYPDTPPTLGVAGSVIVDPFCGNQILRVTDENTDPKRPGITWVTHSSGESNPWAADTSAFVVGDLGGSWFLYDFDPEAFTCKLVDRTPGFGQFSWCDRDLMYGVKEFTLRSWNRTSNQITDIVNFKDYPELAIPTTPRWYVLSLSISVDGHRLCCYLGPSQDKGEIIVVWDTILGLGWLRTTTGEFGGWGKGQIPNWSSLLLHDCRIGKGGNTVRVSTSNVPGLMFWRPGTAFWQLTPPAPEPPVSLGHKALGYSTHYGGDLRSVPCRFIHAPLFAPQLWQDLMDPVPKPVPNWWVDWHISVCPDQHDRNPIFLSSENVQRNPIDGSPPTAMSYFDNEIFAISTDGSGRFWRLAHTYSIARGSFWATPRGNVSLDGRFYVFNSDWQLTLGGTFPKQRVDVFVLHT